MYQVNMDIKGANSKSQFTNAICNFFQYLLWSRNLNALSLSLSLSLKYTHQRLYIYIYMFLFLLFPNHNSFL